jgi:hypothetical protein
MICTLRPSRVHVQPIGERWAAMILGDDASPTGQDEIMGNACFGDTADKAERVAKTHQDEGVPQS